MAQAQPDRVYKVLICGGREWLGATAIRREIKKLIKKYGNRQLLIIEGGARGADQLAGRIAREQNVHVAEVWALWNARHRSAGNQRNAMMLALEPHEVIAFHMDIEHSRGTADMVRKARAKGVPVKIIKG